MKLTIYRKTRTFLPADGITVRGANEESLLDGTYQTLIVSTRKQERQHFIVEFVIVRGVAYELCDHTFDRERDSASFQSFLREAEALLCERGRVAGLRVVPRRSTFAARANAEGARALMIHRESWS